MANLANVHRRDANNSWNYGFVPVCSDFFVLYGDSQSPKTMRASDYASQWDSRYGTEVMNSVRFLKLLGDTGAFRQSAESIEQDSRRLKVKSEDLSPIGGAAEWPSYCVWESLKSVSHFNLAIALELQLKCLLKLHDMTPSKSHSLAAHFVHLRNGQACTAVKLEDLFRQSTNNHPFKLVAFLSTDSPKVPVGSRNRAMSTLKEFLIYMDEDVESFNKRCSWEASSSNKWQHCLDNLNAIFEFIDSTEKLAIGMARAGASHAIFWSIKSGRRHLK